MAHRILLIMFLFALLIGCAPAQVNPTVNKGNPGLNNRKLTYTKSGGLTGLNKTWTISEDGRITVDNSTVYQAPPEMISALFDQIPLDAFIEQSKTPQAKPCPDCFTVVLQFDSGNQTYELNLVLEKTDPTNPVRIWLDKIDALISKYNQK
jgi:hypothetical protein